MAMQEWIQKYPRVAALLQGDDEALLYAVDGERREDDGRRGSTEAWLRLRPYILDGTQPIQVSYEDLGRWRTMTDPHVGNTWVISRTTGAGVQVSTVFLGIDHNWTGQGRPILFETMVFGGGEVWEDVQQRYRTWQEAQEGHAIICQLVRRWLDTGVSPGDASDV